MNGDQIKGILRILATYIGPPIVAWLVKLGATPEQIGAFGDALINMIAAGIPITMGIWSYVANGRLARSKSVGATPGTMVVVDTQKAPADLVMAAIDPTVPTIITTREAAMKLGSVNVRDNFGTTMSKPSNTS